MPKKKRARRTPEQIAEGIDAQIASLEASITEIEEKRKAANADFDSKVQKVHDKISALEKKKKSVLTVKAPRKPRMTKKKKIEALFKATLKSGMKPEEIAEKLGISVDG